MGPFKVAHGEGPARAPDIEREYITPWGHTERDQRAGPDIEREYITLWGHTRAGPDIEREYITPWGHLP